MTSGERHPDYELVQAVLRGAAGAVETFIARMNCIARILGAKNGRSQPALSREDLEDLCQDTFRAIWEKLEDYQGRGSIEAWVYRFCCNVLMNAKQKSRRRPIGVDNPDGVLSRSEAGAEGATADDRDAVYQALERLPARDASILELKHFHDLTFDQIARELGQHSSSIKSRYYRALQHLRRAYRSLAQESMR